MGSRTRVFDKNSGSDISPCLDRSEFRYAQLVEGLRGVRLPNRNNVFVV